MEPLALILYEKILPGPQLVNRLQDLKYRVQNLTDPSQLVECAKEMKPMLVLADLDSTNNNICAALRRLRKNAATQHLPIIAFAAEKTPEIEASAQAAGVNLVVTHAAILTHLSQFLE